jgi:glutathione peroxidase
MASIYDFTAKALDGAITPLNNYRGKTLLIVNVASKCGFTPQYQGLEALYRKFAAKGLVVLGFPSNQFGHQEPGDSVEIRSFCSTNYDVTFPLFGKIDVNGSDADPLYRFLKREARGIFGTERIKWNFTKFLVDSRGSVKKRYAPTAKPSSIENDIAELL